MKPITWSLVGAFAIYLAISVSGAAAKPNRNVAFARLLDEGERPLVGALIRPTGVATGPTVSWGATPAGFPEQVVSDTNGNIMLTRKEPFTRVRVHLEVPQVGWGELWLDAGDVATTVHFGPFEMSMPSQPMMHRPGMVPPGPGRLPAPAQPPTPGAAGFGPPHSPFSAQAGWTNGPARPGASFTRGSVEWPPISVKLCPYPHGQASPTERADVRRLKLAGQVRTRTGEPLPGGLQVKVQSGLEHEQVNPDNEGRFSFSGLPEGNVALSVTPGLSLSHNSGAQAEWAGWRLTAGNRSRSGSPPNYELTGLLQQDKEDLLLVIEQAQVPFGAMGSAWPPPGSHNRALYGAESSGPPFTILSGQVVDDRTGQAVKGVKVSPCRLQLVPAGAPAAKSTLKMVVDAFTPKPDAKPGRVVPEDAEVEVGSNGTFRVAFLPLAEHPLLRVEAPGYVPLETEAFTQSASNLVLRLKTGAGPSGIVLGPEGQPAAGVTVVLTTGKHMVDVHDPNVHYHIAGETVHLSGPDGRFAFEAMPEPGSVFALTPTGYAEEAVGVAGDVVKLRLKPWGALIGTLMTTNGTPAAGMELAVAWMDKAGNGGTSIQELGRTTTDTNGGFAFYNLPPRRLALQHVKRPFAAPGIRSTLNPFQPYTVVVPEPGQTNNLGKVEADPPPSVMDKLKKQLGL